MKIVLEPGDAEWLVDVLALAIAKAQHISAPPASNDRASEWLFLDEAAEYLRIPAETLRAWRRSGRGPASVKDGSRIRFHRQDLDRWLAAPDATA